MPSHAELIDNVLEAALDCDTALGTVLKSQALDAYRAAGSPKAASYASAVAGLQSENRRQAKDISFLTEQLAVANAEIERLRK